MQDFYFQPRWIPGLAAAAGVGLFVHMGLWQADKGQRRQAEIAQFKARAQQGPYRVGAAQLDPEQMQDAPVSVRGVYEGEKQFFIDNRQENGKPGVHVIAPLLIEGTTTRVLVNRGWVGWGASRAVLPKVAVPSGVVEVSGVASQPSIKKFLLMPDHEEALPQLWSRLDVQRFAKRYAVTVQAFVILQNPADAQDALVRHWPPPQDRVAVHQSYSLQWFGMAIALVVFFCVASLRKRVQP